MSMNEKFFQYWAKSDEEGHFHLLPFHGLDVAACAVTLLEYNPGWLERLCTLSTLDKQVLLQTVQVLTALHDLGKFTASFQSLRPDIYQQLQSPQHTKWAHERHDSLGWWLWRSLFPDKQGRRIDPYAEKLNRLVRTVMGHHGRPPVEQPPKSLSDYCTDQDYKAARAYVDTLFKLAALNSVISLKEKAQPIPPEFTWALAGLTTLADWIGSNRHFFPYHDSPQSLSDYWQHALESAQKAIKQIGLIQPQPAPDFQLKACFKTPPANLQPTPLQQWAQTTPLTNEPQLFILEDVTGAGKTEAALILASHLLQHTQATGLYFALPTMATANGLFERIEPVFHRLFKPSSRPNLTLAHSKAHIQDALCHLIQGTETGYGDSTHPVSLHATEWLQDNRKKALLAHVGVGTIDQALMSVLPIRHQSLRLQGLLGKVLIVDEAHACDAYMNELLAGLLKYHAQSGGSAIILSATLPQQQKERLAEAFRQGLGQTAPVQLEKPDYPLASMISRHTVKQSPLQTRSDVVRRIEVRFISSEQALDLLRKSVAQGKCACWIRNTIKDATESYQKLNDTDRAELFHARFTLLHRLKIEKRVLSRFGKSSTHSARAGQILIATQVIEQSLDLDFDVMITDLAPIDLLIQRAGRLHRHRRDTQGNPVDGPDQRGIPILYIVAPEWDEDPDANWLRKALPGTARVYENMDAHLWRTMQLLRERGGWTMPDDARELIEGVYATDLFELPEGLQDTALNAEGDFSSQRSFARFTTLDWAEGYRSTTTWQDEELDTLTRLGAPTQIIWLAQLQDDQLYPFELPDNLTAQDPLAWHLNSLSLPLYLANEEIRPAGVSEAQWQTMKQTLPGKGQYGIVLALSPAGQPNTWQGILGLRHKDTRKRSVLYSKYTGLILQ